ncbi:hypothetical protein F4861DRAFT_255095 [Xylaria intraflava]|nr:hypothetical protein F4861DRAFT_255095 [Xylaria intraflava]
MPPKRKRNDYTVSESESDDVSLHRPTAMTLLPQVMQNIERLKARRDRFRKNITEQFDAFAAGKKKSIEAHYASKTEQRSSEARDLLTRYAEALKQRAAIEKSIEEIVLNAREDLRELTVVLEAAYSGRHQQANAAISSFTPTTLASAEDAAPATIMDPGAAAEKNVLEMCSESRSDKDAKETRADDPDCARETEHLYRKRPKESIFDRILW